MTLFFPAIYKRCVRVMALGIFFLLLLRTTSFADDKFDVGGLYAKSAVLMDADTGRVLVSKDSDKPMPMASTTKIMTCIIALENANPDLEITCSKYADSMPEVSLKMKEGEKFYLRDLLYSLMLESHNDTAVAIAEGVAGDVSSFLKLMNEKAKEIGCVDTLFLTPNGLDKQITDDEGKILVHHTTARELAKIMSYCINESPKKDEFLKVTQVKAYNFTNIEGSRSYSCINHNAFLSMMDGALSGKTGFTADAGYCYVGSLKRDERCFIVSLLACGWPNNKSYKWKDTRNLMNYGINNFSFGEVNLSPQVVEREVLEGEYNPFKENGATIGLIYEPFSMKRILISKDESVKYIYELEKYIEAPVEKGQEIGKVKCLINDDVISETRILSAVPVQRKSLIWAVREVASVYINGNYF